MEASGYDVGAEVGMLVVAVVLAKGLTTIFSKVVLLSAWFAELGDARLAKEDA